MVEKKKEKKQDLLNELSKGTQCTFNIQKHQVQKKAF